MTVESTLKEYVRRRGRAQDALRRSGWDALWVGTEANFRYFTGIATPSFASRTRPLNLILLAEGAPVIVVARSHMDHMRRASSIEDVVGFDGFETQAVDAIVGVIRERRLEGGRIAAELGGELRLPVTYSGFVDLQERLPHAEWLDGSRLVWSLRQLKSSAEVAALREAGRITGLAFDALLAEVRPGVTQRDLYATFNQTAATLGADRVGYFSIHHGLGQDQRSNASPSSGKLARSDLLWMDAGVVYDGYWSDFTRMALVGAADPHRNRFYRFVHDASAQLLAMVRPGIRASDLMHHCETLFAAEGFAIGNATRIGHGVGLDITEPPSIVGNDDTELREGMVLAIEPGIRTESGYFVVEENFVVTANGASLLSPRAPADLPVI